MSKAMNLRIARQRIAKKKHDRERKEALLRLNMEIARIQAALDFHPMQQFRPVSH